MWCASSALGAILLGLLAVKTPMRRRKAIGNVPIPLATMIALGAIWVAVLMLTVEALLTAVSPGGALAAHASGLFAFAVTLRLAATMAAFVRRVASLLGDEVGADWDPRRA